MKYKLAISLLRHIISSHHKLVLSFFFSILDLIMTKIHINVASAFYCINL